MANAQNDFDDVATDPSSFTWAEIQGRDTWTPFTPVFGSLTVVGATAYSGRLRFVGHKCEFQVQFSAATSIASVAGTSYLTLPVNAQGLAGIATMMNSTTGVAVGVCVIDAASAATKCWLPTQVASGNTFLLCGSYEI